MDETPAVPEVIAIPSDRAWLDPLLLNVLFSIRQTEVVIPAGSPVVLCPMVPARWAIGIFTPPTVPLPFFAPWPDPHLFPFVAGSISAASFWGKLFDYGPLVGNAWFGFSAGGVTVRILELIRNT